MKEKELRKTLSRLPAIKVGTIAKGNEIIGNYENGCYHKVRRVIIPIFNMIMYMLSASGLPQDRQKLITQFIGILGEPFDRFHIKELPNIDFVSWDGKKKINAKKRRVG